MGKMICGAFGLCALIGAVMGGVSDIGASHGAALGVICCAISMMVAILVAGGEG